MVTKGFKRLTPTHVHALVQKYRRALGELRYCERYQLGTTEIRECATALAEALRICAPELDFLGLQPIPYQPAPPLSTAALTRHVLARLRQSAVTSEALVQAVARTADLDDSPPTRQWLGKRIPQTLKALQKRGIVTESGGEWSLHTPSASPSRRLPCQ